jgi:hypothetical protein
VVLTLGNDEPTLDESILLLDCNLDFIRCPLFQDGTFLDVHQNIEGQGYFGKSKG